MPKKRETPGSLEEYRGSVTLPGEKEPRRFVLLLDKEGQSAELRFDTEVAVSAEWHGVSVRVVQRLKYHETIFSTAGLPVEGIGLTWKLNVDLQDGTVAGVVVAQPNDKRITGEKGFTLTRPA